MAVPFHKSATVVHRELLIRMVREGATIAAMADAAGTNHTQIGKFLKREKLHRDRCSMKGDRNPNWRGGRILDKTGYVLIYMPNHPDRNHLGYVREHRLVMAMHLGRQLLSSEVVHHENKDKQDNRIENLRIYSRNSEHLAVELKGKTPKWTQDGLARMKAGIARSAVIRRERIALRLKQSAEQSP